MEKDKSSGSGKGNKGQKAAPAPKPQKPAKVKGSKPDYTRNAGTKPMTRRQFESSFEGVQLHAARTGRSYMSGDLGQHAVEFDGRQAIIRLCNEPAYKGEDAPLQVVVRIEEASDLSLVSNIFVPYWKVRDQDSFSFSPSNLSDDGKEEQRMLHAFLRGAYEHCDETEVLQAPVLEVIAPPEYALLPAEVAKPNGENVPARILGKKEATKAAKRAEEQAAADARYSHEWNHWKMQLAGGRVESDFQRLFLGAPHVYRDVQGFDARAIFSVYSVTDGAFVQMEFAEKLHPLYGTPSGTRVKLYHVSQGDNLDLGRLPASVREDVIRLCEYLRQLRTSLIEVELEELAVDESQPQQNASGPEVVKAPPIAHAPASEEEEDNNWLRLVGIAA